MLTPIRESMKNCWDTLKTKGLFKDYSSYEGWLEKQGYNKTSFPIQPEAPAGEIDVAGLPS